MFTVLVVTGKMDCFEVLTSDVHLGVIEEHERRGIVQIIARTPNDELLCEENGYQSGMTIEVEDES